MDPAYLDWKTIDEQKQEIAALRTEIEDYKQQLDQYYAQYARTLQVQGEMVRDASVQANLRINEAAKQQRIVDERAQAVSAKAARVSAQRDNLQYREQLLDKQQSMVESMAQKDTVVVNNVNATAVSASGSIASSR